MDWVIHIGYQKTGSKALQRFFAHEPERRPDTRLAYPLAGRDRLWHRPMHDLLLLGDPALVRAAVAEVSAASHDLAVLSYEGFCTMPVQAIRMLRSEVGPARIVLFLRRQDDLANSMLNQVVMGHQTGWEWIEEFRTKIADYDAMLDYRVLLSNWAECFGEQNLVPLLYGKEEDVSVRFGKAVGLPVLPLDETAGNPNPALDAEGIRLLCELKQGVPDEELPALVQRSHERLADRMIDTFRQQGVGLIDPKTRATINSHYVESNEWVRKRWFPERATLFEPDER
jgi:hypothetical protein